MHKLIELKIWHNAIDLAAQVYSATAHFPKEETYGLTSQIRRSAVSVPSNIAEGAGRNTNGDFKHFLAIANGSSYELQTQIIIAQRLELLDAERSAALLDRLDDLQKMNYRLQQSLLTLK